jgi:hypothetical protein
VGSQLVEGCGGVGEEVLAQQQVLGRVAGERELRKQHEFGAGSLGVFDPGANAGGVAREIAHRGVHLAEGQAQAASSRRVQGREVSLRCRRVGGVLVGTAGAS